MATKNILRPENESAQKYYEIWLFGRLHTSAQSQLDLSRHKEAQNRRSYKILWLIPRLVRYFGWHSRHTAGSLCRHNKTPVRDLPPLRILFFFVFWVQAVNQGWHMGLSYLSSSRMIQQNWPKRHLALRTGPGLYFAPLSSSIGTHPCLFWEDMR